MKLNALELRLNQKMSNQTDNQATQGQQQVLLILNNQKCFLNKYRKIIYEIVIYQKRNHQVALSKESYTFNYMGIQLNIAKFLNYRWHNLQYINLVECNIDTEGWDLLVSKSFIFQTLKVLYIQNNQIKIVTPNSLKQFVSLKYAYFGKQEQDRNPLNEQSQKLLYKFQKIKQSQITVQFYIEEQLIQKLKNQHKINTQITNSIQKQSISLKIQSTSLNIGENKAVQLTLIQKVQNTMQNTKLQSETTSEKKFKQISPQKLKSSYDFITQKVQKYIPKIKIMAQKQNKTIGLIGPTGSGKSTLISYLLGAKMSFQKKHGQKYIINHKDNNEKYPIIGNSMQSCTFIPQIYKLKDQCIVDLPGWFETGQSNYEIINAFSNSSIFTRGKQVKIAIVLQVSCLSINRGQSLVQCLQRLAELFEGDLDKMINSIILIVSKVNTQQCDIQYIQEEIKAIRESNKRLNSLIRNKRVLLFPTPERILTHIQDINNRLAITKFTCLAENSKITLSKRTYCRISSYVDILNSEIVKAKDKIFQEINDKFKSENYHNGEKINQDLCKLRKAAGILNKQLGKFSQVKDQLKILEDLNNLLNLSKDSALVLTKNLAMSEFYHSLDEKVDISSKFLENFSSQISQNIKKLELKRQQLTSNDERKAMQAQYSQQSRLRDQRTKKGIQQLRKRQNAQRKQYDQKIARQQLEFEKKQKQLQEKQRKKMQQLQMQLHHLRNNQQIVHHYRADQGHGCQIM